MTEEARQVLSIAKAWLAMSEKATAGPDAHTNRFVTLWIAFNALYALHFDEEEHDKAQVLAFGRWPVARTVHLAALESADYAQALSDLAEKGVYNYLKKRLESLLDRRDLERVMVLVYQVRCNLFHGRKCPSDLRDQMLIRAAHVIVRKLVVTLLEREIRPRVAA